MAAYKLRRLIGMGETESLKVFLMSRLQPWRWQPLIDAGAITVEAGGKAVDKLTLSYQLSATEVVVINDDAPGVDAKMRAIATKQWNDYVFCPQRAGDTFLTNQVDALLLEPTCADIGVEFKDFQALVANLHRFGPAPTRYLVVVSHASDNGDILLPMRPSKDEKDLNAFVVNWESLNEAIADKALAIPPHEKKPVFMPRPEVGGKPLPRALLVRGCTSGRHPIFLKKLHEALGGGVDTVVMPKFFDACNLIGGTTTKNAKGVVEYFMHNFVVTSPVKLTRDQVIAALKAKKFTDWLGNPVADTEWNDLVPPNVEVDVVPVKELKVKVDGRSEVLTMHTRFERAHGATNTLVMQSADKPDSAAIQKAVVDSWKRTKMFSDTEWPMWKRYDKETLDEFVAMWTFEEDPAFKPKPPSGSYAVHASLFSYTVRTPLLENNTLLANYHPVKEKGTATNTIDYNDNRIFGRAGVIDKAFAQTL